MKIGDEVYVHGYVDEIRQGVVIIRNNGGYFGTVLNEVIVDRKDEPQLTPNYCGTCKHREVPCGDLPCDVCHGYSNYEPKDEPTISKMEQVDEPKTERSE